MRGRKEGTDAVRFFNASLINANVMSVPRFPQPQRLIGELIHSIEAASPKFAWVQLLFRRVNYSPALVALKNEMNYAVEQIKTPKRSLIDDSEYDRPELHRDWYKRSSERIKRIDATVNKPHVLLGIQGMWVGTSGLASSLPFKDCHDELDRLGVFVYKNPWMLAELVERRMVEDISPYIVGYARSRLEPPSFLVTQEDVAYYVHLPVLKTPGFLKSINRTQYSGDIATGSVEGAETTGDGSGSTVLRLAKVPTITEPLKEKETERLSMLPSAIVRGFEVVFDGTTTGILLSSRTAGEMGEYLSVLNSVYGELDVRKALPMPEFLKQIPEIVGLVPSTVSGR